ncbi:MAG: hypothetical protein AABX35_04900 [Nanoarchaeota archaeon]
MPFKDIEKKKEWRRSWYLKNKESVKKDVRNRKKEIRKWINEYKNNLKCKLCSEDHPAVIDFHHHSGKEFEIAYMVANGYSIERIKKELEKCEVLCSNCHRKLHYTNKKL